MNILYAFLIIASLGLALGVGLAVAAKKFAVKKDARAELINEVLPGANCGACGYPGCAGYADALSKGEAENGLCSPGGAKTTKAVADILGVDSSGVSEKMVAFVHCKGHEGVSKQDYEYMGITECNAAHMLFKGEASCKYGCHHLGTCMSVCPTDAIYRDEIGNIVVNPELCIGCKKCTLVCPTQVIKMIPYRGTHVVACNNRDKGAVVRKICSVGCIACKICEKKFPLSGCVVTDNLSVIDYSVSNEEIEGAAAACPTKCIIAAH